MKEELDSVESSILEYRAKANAKAVALRNTPEQKAKRAAAMRERRRLNPEAAKIASIKAAKRATFRYQTDPVFRDSVLLRQSNLRCRQRALLPQKEES